MCEVYYQHRIFLSCGIAHKLKCLKYFDFLMNLPLPIKGNSLKVPEDIEKSRDSDPLPRVSQENKIFELTLPNLITFVPRY